MPKNTMHDRPKTARYRKARIRNFLFTVGPDRLSRGRIVRRHLAGELVVREIETSSPRWPRELDGLRIGHVSDFHLGHIIKAEHALAALDQLSAMQPDLVACTGDVVDLHHHEAPPVLREMAAINAPLGSYLVLGNHDELHCRDTMMRLARAAGIILLHDDAVAVNHNGAELMIAGISWSRSKDACAQRVDRATGGECHLLLAHNPRAFQRAAELRIPLTLSGHTHGGQIALKHRPGANLAMTHRHRVGLFERGPSRLYVTAGVGSWFPVRLNCPAEVAMITMRHEATDETSK